MKGNEEINDAIIKVRKMTEDEKMERLAFLRQKAIMDEEAIRDAGFEDGIENEKIRIIKKLHSMNMPIEQIANIVEVNVEEVKDMINKR